MESGELGEVVDKLANKIGLAAEKLQPLAEETVRQYANWGIAQVCLGVCTLGVTILLLYASSRLFIAGHKPEVRDKGVTDDYESLSVVAFLAAMGAALTALILISMGIKAWVAPIAGILGM